jgi:hypothetical protein
VACTTTGAVRSTGNTASFSKHLAIYHQEREGEVLTFRFTVEEVYNMPLSRLCSESVMIHNDTCKIPMNSKAEWHQPVVARVLVTMQSMQ